MADTGSTHTTYIDTGETIVISATHDGDQIGQPQTITITEAFVLPEVSIVAAQSTVTESIHSQAAFTLTRSGETSAPLTVTMGIQENCYTIVANDDTVTFLAGDNEYMLGYTIPSDNVNQPDCDFTATVTVELDSPYQVSPTNGSATIRIVDDDADPLPRFSLTSTDPDHRASVEEGGTFTITAAIDNGVVHWQALTGFITVSDKEASSDDYQVMGTFKLPEKETSIAVELQTVKDMVVEGDETLIVFVALQVGTVLHTASPVTLTIRNNDEPKWVVTAAPSAIEEGGAGAATLTVDTGGVTFPDNQTIGLELGGEATVGTDYTISDSEAMALTAPYSLTLPAEAMTVTATIAASSDTVADPGETIVITATHDSDQIGQPQAITITDGGTAGVAIDYSTKPMTLTVPEGGSNTYTVVLDTQPSDVVTVTVNGHTGSDLMISPASLTFDTVSGHEGTDLSVNPSSLTFTCITWHTPQTVTVRAKGDLDAAKDETVILTHLVRSVDTDYAGIESELVSVTIIENDTAGVTIDYSTKPVSLTVPEGGSNTYTVALISEPTGVVTVTASVTAHAPDVISLSGATLMTNNVLTFDAMNWSTPQTVTVSAAQDDDAVHNIVLISHAVDGTGEYESLSLPPDDVTVAVTLQDNDTAAVRISSTTLTVPEGGRAIPTP